MKWLVTVCLACTIATGAFAQELVKIPPLRAHVNDYADILSDNVEAEIEAKLVQLEKEDSTQVVVVTVPSIGNEDIESYSIRLAKKWKIGQKGLDNGVIILVARNNRKVRIEVGKGLEETLTDLLAGRIIDYIIIPEFKNGDYDAGISKAVDAIVDIVKGKFDSSTLKPQNAFPGQVIFIYIAYMIIMYSVGALRPLASALLNATVIPIIGAFFGLEFLKLIILAIIGFLAGIILSPLFYNRGKYSNGEFLSGGGFSSGGSFSSGGGFSGGGGSFGGGGASGSW